MSSAPIREASSPNGLRIANYAVCFIDLLGQRSALEGQGCLPEFRTDEERDAFFRAVRASVGSIAALQTRAEAMMGSGAPAGRLAAARSAARARPSTLGCDSHRSNVTTQRWSDGLVFFACLADGDVPCQSTSIFDLLFLAGSLCLLGLASQQPLRGGVEIAWGIELHAGEIYGAAVARAYELESSRAGWPRILVGDEMVRYLDTLARDERQDVYSRANRGLAERCRKLLRRSPDGAGEIDYLGSAFRESITQANHPLLARQALAFAQGQLTRFRECGDQKLYERYQALCDYFNASAG